MPTTNMKTIAFYSFKGGTGRSLAAAQLAVCLARFGKSVCILDFDFEAPGLHHKFDSVRTIPKFNLGAIDYIFHFAREGREGDDPDIDKLPEPPTLDKIAVKIPSSDPRGVVFLIPAGDIFAPKQRYFRILSSRTWQDFMLLETKRSRDFFDRFKKLMEVELKPTPEYLIIDSRSGVNELSGICTRFWAKDDAVVFLTANHVEGFEGSSLILQSFQDARKDGKDAPDASYVELSRMPPYYIDDKGNLQWYSKEELKDARMNARGLIYSRAEEEIIHPIYVLASEPRLEIKEELPMKFTGEALNSQLSVDFINFFGKIVPEIKDQLEELIPSVRVLRPYLLVEDDGRLINPEDNEWNVAFRKDTIVKTFERLYNAILKGKKGLPQKEAEENANEELFETGIDAVERFSAYMRRLRETKGDEAKRTPTYQDSISAWCAFDSRVGFGRFDSVVWGEGKAGYITLHNNFLVEGRSREESNLCAFMRGYITRVLQAIFDTDHVVVKHDLDKDCGQRKGPGEDDCVFHFEVTS